MTNNIFMQIESYILSKKNAWSPKTLGSEMARLVVVAHLLDKEPEQLYEALKTHYKPYTLRTVFVRIAEFKQWTGDSSFKTFMKDNARLFKNNYERKPVGYSFKEAQERINQIENPHVKQIAQLMLSTGLRVHEAQAYDGSGAVIGKGLKKRPVFSSVRIEEKLEYHTIRRHLAKVGLKPHDLRKLAATKLAEAGMRNIDLMEVMGWSSMETASSYLQPSSLKHLEEQVKGALK